MATETSSEAPANPFPWLQPRRLKTMAARRFALFCIQDFPTLTQSDGFDPAVYEDAVRLVIERLEASRGELSA